MTFVSIPRPQRSPIPAQIITVIAGSALLIILGLGAVSFGYQLLYSERVFPGISMAGVDLTNLNQDQVRYSLEKSLTFPTQGRILLRYNDKTWLATPQELGMEFDLEGSVQRALGTGRRDNLFINLENQVNAWKGGDNLDPVVVYDEPIASAYLRGISELVDQPLVETTLNLEGTNVVYTQGQPGRLLDVDASLQLLKNQLSTFKDGEVWLVVNESNPQVADAIPQAQLLRDILSMPLIIKNPEAENGGDLAWTIDPSTLAGMISIARVQNNGAWAYQISINNLALTALLDEIAPQVEHQPRNARFIFNDDTRQLDLIPDQKAQPGTKLDYAATINAIETALLSGGHEAFLVISQVAPQVGDDATAESLGISGRVSEYTTYFRGSSSARLQNIDTARQKFLGLLVPPNTTFSMGEAIGDISLDNNYAEALIIYNGRTITGVGGGVCQVSTTLFRTAFFGGYPIIERHAHAYRVGFYEQTRIGTDDSLAGLDATVYFPLVDLTFKNDRPYWLLMETYFNREKSSLTWKFYSGDDGRTTEWHNLGLENVVPAPEPLIEENPDLSTGVCKQVDYQADGALVTVLRTVKTGLGETLIDEGLQTLYEPWQAVFQFGPGTENPKDLVEQGLCH